MRPHCALAMAMMVVGCDYVPTDPCASTDSKPVLEIRAVEDSATAAKAVALSLSNITLGGAPIDTVVLRSNILHNVERSKYGIGCLLPCTFGTEPGTYAFDTRSNGFYPTHHEVTASYTDAPIGCPESHERATGVTLNMVEADSARARFYFLRRTNEVAQDGAYVTFDDGSGPLTAQVTWPGDSFMTKNDGTLHVRFVVGAPDTIGVGVVDLPLMKDTEWSVGAYLYDQNPEKESFCIKAKGFPLRRAVAGADSLYVGWSYRQLSISSSC